MTQVTRHRRVTILGHPILFGHSSSGLWSMRSESGDASVIVTSGLYSQWIGFHCHGRHVHCQHLRYGHWRVPRWDWCKGEAQVSAGHVLISFCLD